MTRAIAMCVALWLAGVGESASATTTIKQTRANPFVGSWSANLSKSKLDPKYEFRGATIDISVGDDTVTIASTMIGPNGEQQKGTETLRTDGRETKGSLTPGVFHDARWVGEDVLVITARKEGQRFALMTYELSPDRKTLTVRSSGLLDQVVVFDRK